MARSSPKFGSVTMTPSICSRFLLEQLGALARFGVRFHRAVLGLLRPTTRAVAAFSSADHLLAPALAR